MTKDQETKLAARAREAAALRKTADEADSMLRSWTRRKASGPTAKVRLSLGDDGASRWWVHIALDAAGVDRELVPILRRIRDQARADLAALEMP